MKTSPKISVSLNDLTKLEHMVSDFSLLPQQPVHSVLSGKHASKLRGRGLDFSEVRKYVHGDDIRNIDWKVTARTRVTHTKVFNEEKERPAFMIVDQSTSMFFASEGTIKSVIAAKIAAISGFKVLKSGDRIGGIVFNDVTYESIPPKRSRKTLMHLLENVVSKNQELVKREAMLNKTDMINKVLYKAKNMITHDYVVVIVSDFSQLNEVGREYLAGIAQHNDVIAIMINDPMEMNIPAVKVPLADGNNQLLFSGKTEISLKYKAHATEKREETLDFLSKYGIPAMELSTDQAIDSQLKKIFGKA